MALEWREECYAYSINTLHMLIALALDINVGLEW